MPLTPQKILIDTDPGDDVDDILAIAFALLRPELDVRAITTVTGDTVKRGHLIAKLLAVMGRTDDVPVAAGMELPLRSFDAAGRAHWLEQKGYRLNHYPWVTTEPDNRLPQISDDAIGLLARTIRENPGEIILTAIGPLTNVAVLLHRFPDVAEQLKGIAIMGGEVEGSRKEHNITTDPVAADIVFTSGVRLFVGTWSVTRGFVLSPDDCSQIAGANTPLTDALSACIDLWWPHKHQKPGAVMYDLAPILWSMDPSFYPTEPRCLRVETRDEATTGMTLPARGTPNADVSIAIRAEAVRELYLETILGTPHRAQRNPL